MWKRSYEAHIHNKRRSCKVAVLQTFRLFTLITAINHSTTVSITYVKKIIITTSKPRCAPFTTAVPCTRNDIPTYLKQLFPRSNKAKAGSNYQEEKHTLQTKSSLTQDREPSPTGVEWPRVAWYLQSGRWTQHVPTPSTPNKGKTLFKKKNKNTSRFSIKPCLLASRSPTRPSRPPPVLAPCPDRRCGASGNPDL